MGLISNHRNYRNHRNQIRTIEYPCRMKYPIIIDGQPCRYILDVIDDEIYGTNSFEIYNLYKGIFYDIKEEHTPIDQDEGLCRSEATQDAFKRGMDQEQLLLAEGYHYVSEWVTINGIEWVKGHWEKKI